MRKRKQQTVKKLIQCAAIIAAGVLAIILFMLAIWYRGKNSEPVTDEQVAEELAKMQKSHSKLVVAPEGTEIADEDFAIIDFTGSSTDAAGRTAGY